MKKYMSLKIRREWRNRSNRDNYFQNVKWLERHVVPMGQMSQNALPWVFSRQPGVKGDVLVSYLAQLFSQQDIVHFDEQELLEFPQLLSLKDNFPNFISGIHASTSVLYQMLPDNRMVHLTMLKEPVSRVVSCYNNKATKQFNNKSKSISDLHFESLMTKQERETINNAQAKALAGLVVESDKISDSELYFFAKYALDNCFSLIGVTMYFTEFIQLIRKTTGVDLIEMPTASNNKTKIILTNITKEQIDQIKTDNQVDQQLYLYAKSKFESLIDVKKKNSNIVSFFSR